MNYHCRTLLPLYRIYLLNMCHRWPTPCLSKKKKDDTKRSLSYLVLMDKKGRQSNITLYTWGLCGAAIGVSRHYHGSGYSISCAWWWNCHKKRDLSVFTTPETNEVLREVSPQWPASLVSLLQVPHISFPEPPHFTTVKVCIYQEEET